jgi:prepilin-type N-terminal cleavage/methylation domain-containing protein
MKQLRTGFTMIELIVVMAIMGILAVIAVPAFSAYIESSRLKFSQQIVETTLGKAFSRARSHPESISIHGWADSRSMEILLNDEEPNQTPCSQESVSCQKLDRGITFLEKFQIMFIPPYGDIFSALEGSETVIQLKSRNYIVKMQVHHASGLIETLIPPSE